MTGGPECLEMLECKNGCRNQDGHHSAIAAPARNSLYFRVRAGTDDDGKLAGKLRFFHNSMDALDKGASGIHDLHALLFKGFADRS